MIPQVHPYDLYRISTRSINAIMNFMSWFDHVARRGEVTSKFYKIFRYAKTAHPYDPVKKTNYETTIMTLGIEEATESLLKVAAPEVLQLYDDMKNNRTKDGNVPLLAAAEMQSLPPSEFEEVPVTRGVAPKTPEQQADEYLQDPEIQTAIANLERVSGKAMSYKQKNLAVQKRLHLANVKVAVLEALNRQFHEFAPKAVAPEVIASESAGLEDQTLPPEEPKAEQEAAGESLL